MQDVVTIPELTGTQMADVAIRNIVGTDPWGELNAFRSIKVKREY